MSEEEIIKIWEKEFEEIEKDLEDNEQRENYEDIVSYGFDLKTIRTIEELIKIVKQQQKEIEDLRIIADDIEEHNIVYTDTPEFEERFISKNKIRDKIKELEEIGQMLTAEQGYWGSPKLLNQMEILKELLGE